MENLEELIPFIRELLTQKPSRGLLKVYLVGSVFTLLGTVIGLVETVCQPFSSGGTMDMEMDLLLASRQRTVDVELQHSIECLEGEEEAKEEESHTHQTMTFSETPRMSQRGMANRSHAS